MRRIVVSMCLCSMLAALVGLGATRDRPELVDPPEAVPEATSASDDTGAAAEREAPAEPATPDAVKEPVSIKVVGSSWEVLAPGVLAHGGLLAGEHSKFAASGLDVTFTAATDATQIETMLGLGGDSPGGADVALMPLPTFVASYERLRALAPQVFFVVAWSRGGDALTGDVSLVRNPRATGRVSVAGRPGSSESLLALFALERAGVSPARVDVVDRGRASPTDLVSVPRTRSRTVDASEVFLSTADATHLIPIVAIAPRNVLSDKRDAIADWSRVWLAGTAQLQGDPAGAARTLAEQTGAPLAVDLIDALGWMRFADLHESAAAIGLSGRRAATVDALFSRTWNLWRASGLLATPPPEHLPLSAMVIAELAAESSVAPSALPSKLRPGTDDALVKPVIVHRVPGQSLSTEAESALIGELGFLADVFARSRFRVWVPQDPAVGNRVVAHAAARFGLDDDRFTVVAKRSRKRGAAAIIEILPAQ